jgi:hypothetical protein
LLQDCFRGADGRWLALTIVDAGRRPALRSLLPEADRDRLAVGRHQAAR